MPDDDLQALHERLEARGIDGATISAPTARLRAPTTTTRSWS